jgi:hypothetical protein
LKSLYDNAADVTPSLAAHKKRLNEASNAASSGPMPHRDADEMMKEELMRIVLEPGCFYKCEPPGEVPCVFSVVELDPDRRKYIQKTSGLGHQVWRGCLGISVLRDDGDNVAWDTSSVEPLYLSMFYDSGMLSHTVKFNQATVKPKLNMPPCFDHHASAIEDAPILNKLLSDRAAMDDDKYDEILDTLRHMDHWVDLGVICGRVDGSLEVAKWAIGTQVSLGKPVGILDARSALPTASLCRLELRNRLRRLGWTTAYPSVLVELNG